eukprot:707910_1
MAPPWLPDWWGTKHTILSLVVGTLAIVGIIGASVYFSDNAGVDPKPSKPKLCAAPPDDSILTKAGLRFVGFQSDAKTACEDANECAVVCKDKSFVFDQAKSGKVEKAVCTRLLSSG